LSELWVGADFALGYRREGDVPFLTEQGTAKGFRVNVVDMVQAEATGMVISSTLIRRALAEGQVEQVRQWLGRSYQVSGTVIHGQKRGRMIGFPTANMEVWEQQVIPANGIYASWAYYNGVRYMAMTNVGVSPTFGNKDVTVEPYLLDFDREIYGEALTVSFEKYMRPELKFDNLEDLIARIQQDVIEGREFLTTMERTP
jgi:riboflavin kinase/FMN adenylyltransferase